MIKRIIRKGIDKGKHHASYWKGEILFMIELLKHEEISWVAKLLVFTLLSYIFSPIDLIPDFVPVIGHWDDLLALPIIMWMIKKLTKAELIASIRANIDAREDVALFTGWGPKLAALTVVIIWIWISHFTLQFFLPYIMPLVEGIPFLENLFGDEPH
ncbi:MAG: DUF1232 domain-containing protein [Candidatus Heimdallarchaeota archaeon]|nr:DUF1232 domain-containing protein [Candidatus Heimdallarchaeota archaeon]